MSITIDLPPPTEAVLRAQASAQGVEVDEYIQALVEQASGKVFPPKHTWEEFERDWKAFCEPIQGLPQDVDLSREAIYAEHD